MGEKKRYICKLTSCHLCYCQCRFENKVNLSLHARKRRGGQDKADEGMC